MKTCIIYYSYSGKTRNVAEKLKESLNSDIFPIEPNPGYSSLTVLLKGCYRARRGSRDLINLDTIDISGYDQVIVASPVWAGRPTPAINGAIERLSGSKGKRTFVILTCNDMKSGTEAMVSLKKSLVEKGLVITGEAVLDKRHVNDDVSLSNIMNTIRSDNSII